MDKKEFLKALFIVGLINTIITLIITCLLGSILFLIKLVPLVAIVILAVVIIGYSSAFIYLKMKGKE